MWSSPLDDLIGVCIVAAWAKDISILVLLVPPALAVAGGDFLSALTVPVGDMTMVWLDESEDAREDAREGAREELRDLEKLFGLSLKTLGVGVEEPLRTGLCRMSTKMLKLC